ncbi:MAG: DUF6788 family protein [Patescibacteria group bacterium]
MDLSQVRKQIATDISKRAMLEKELINSRHKMTMGTLVERYVVCGKPGCKCTMGAKHGPFLYLYKMVDGKNIRSYINKKDIKLIKALGRYKLYQQKLAEIRGLNKEINELFNKLRDGLS